MTGRTKFNADLKIAGEKQKKYKSEHVSFKSDPEDVDPDVFKAKRSFQNQLSLNLFNLNVSCQKYIYYFSLIHLIFEYLIVIRFF